MIGSTLAALATGLSRPSTLRQFRKLRRAQHADPAAIAAAKETLLRDVLAYAFAHVPYYRRTLAPYREVWEGHEFSWKGFRELPTLTKAIVRDEFENLQSDEAGRLRTRQNRSGGSTGTPTLHVQDEHFRRMDMANNLLFKSWCGVELGERMLMVSADENDYFDVKASFTTRLASRVLRKRHFNLYRLDANGFERLRLLMNEWRPSYVQSYELAAFEFARFLLETGRSCHRPKMLMCIAGTVYPEMLDTIERALKCRAVARYGSRETGDMAGLCRMRRYHEMSFTHHLEVLPGGESPGRAGDLAVTVLTNRAMPLIRYQIGDFAVMSDDRCGCGVSFPAIDTIAGRTGQIIRTRKGKLLLPVAVLHLIGVASARVADGVERFQVVQRSPVQLEVRLVLRDPGRPPAAAALQELKSKLIALMEDEVDVRFVFTDVIPPLPSGKFCYTLSDPALIADVKELIPHAG